MKVNPGTPNWHKGPESTNTNHLNHLPLNVTLQTHQSYPLTQQYIWSGVGCFAYTHLPCLVNFGACSGTRGGLQKEHSVSVHRRSNSFWLPRGAKTRKALNVPK